jgi:hypothetical protein
LGPNRQRTQEEKVMRKPHWLSEEAFATMIQNCGGVPRCAITGDTEDLSIDHIVPRHHGGTDDISNLQFMKAALNSSKGRRPDRYWSQSFYFDQMPNLQQCRGAQRGIYNSLLAAAAWFAQPTSTIARLLYVTPMVVGAGKTLAMLTAACAYNAIMRARWGYPRRANRILVLAKEQAIRDQIARDLEIDSGPRGYGIFPTLLRVLVIKRGDQLDQEALLQSHDVVVACIQQLWDRSSENLVSLLHRFPMIFIDEPHFAIDQVQAIVQNAATSVCFGTTGTPINAAGGLLAHMVNVFSFGYHDADAQDRSMKFIDPVNWQRHIYSLALDQTTQLDMGRIITRSDTYSNQYGKNFEPAKQVAWEVIRHIDRCDKINLEHADKAEHRKEYDCNLSIWYPVHAMLVADSVRFGNHLARTINEFFDMNRHDYPRERGFVAEIVHAEGEEPDGSKRSHKPLTPDHPWMRAKSRPNYQLDAHCARFLIVIGMGREGVNNPLCGVVGMTSDRANIIEVVQRIIGRQMRAIIKWTDDGVLCVPPVELDSIKIITHEAFSSLNDELQAGIDFVANMNVHLQQLPTVLDLLNDQVPEQHVATDTEIALPFADKWDIAGLIGGNPNINNDLLIGTFARRNPGKEGAVADWIELVRTEPEKAGKQLRLNVQLRQIPTVLHENIKHDPTDRQLKSFLLAKYPHLANEDITNANRCFARALFLRDAEEVNATTPLMLNQDGTPRTLDDIRKTIGSSIIGYLGRHFDYENASSDFWSFIGSAVKIVLGVPQSERASNNSQWNIPNCHIILEWSDIQRDIRSWVISQMIAEGMLPNHVALLPAPALRMPRSA